MKILAAMIFLTACIAAPAATNIFHHWNFLDTNSILSNAAYHVDGPLVMKVGPNSVLLGDISGVSHNINIFQTLRWTFNGNPSSGTGKDSARRVDQDGFIVSVVISALSRGSGPTNASLFDINLHTPTNAITTQQDDTPGVTIYTTQANRPKISGVDGDTEKNAIYQTPMPDITNFTAGAFFTLDVDNVNGDIKDVAIEMEVRYDNSAP